MLMSFLVLTKAINWLKDRENALNGNFLDRGHLNYNKASVFKGIKIFNFYF